MEKITKKLYLITRIITSIHNVYVSWNYTLTPYDLVLATKGIRTAFKINLKHLFTT